MLPSELVEILRLSSFPADSDAYNAASRPESPERRRLVEQIYYSRKLILTYYAAIAVIVLPFVICHWTIIVRRRTSKKRLQNIRDGIDTPTSRSSSSTISDIRRKERRTPEETPLLGDNARSRPSSLAVLLRYVTAFLMQQPEPITALTAPSNVLPPYGTQSLVILLLGVNIFYLFFRIPLTIPMLFAFADRAGLCFTVNLPILYTLAAKTNQPLQYLTGWSYEGLNLFHRRLGEWMIIVAAVHGTGMFGAWYTLLRPLGFTLLMFLSSKVILLGIFAFIAYLAIWITSLGWVRRLYYETFLSLHIVVQFAALSFLFFHFHIARPYVIASILIWALDRILNRLCISNTQAVATFEVADDKQTVLLFCDIPLHRADTGLKTNITNGWQAGQHVFVTVPGISWTHRLQAHPFTIASPAPPKTLRDGVWPLQLTIRAQDGFSKELLEYAGFNQHTEVYLDGPYGSLDALEAAHAANRVCFIAGGSGIAVTYPIAYDLKVIDQEKAMASTRNIYENGVRRRPTISTAEITEDKTKYAHVWVRQDVRTASWIKYIPTAGFVEGYGSRRQSDDFKANGDLVTDLITSTFETAGPGGNRPDIKTELRAWVESGKTTSDVIVVVVSGPDGLVRDVRNGAAALVRAGYHIAVHVEKFGW